MRWKTILVTLGGLMVLFSACGGTPQASTTTSISALLPITTYAATARVQPGKITPVSVSCPSGEQMLGGGFQSFDLFEYAAAVEASYPSSATTWTVVGSAPASFFDLEADVYCSPTRVPLGVQTPQATGTGATSVTCPRGTELLSGGFQSPQPVGVSHPQSNGWMGAAVGTRIRVYALCAANHILRGQVVTSTFNAHSSSHNYAPESREVFCPTGQVAAGGGFEGKELIVGSEMSGSSFAGWSVAAGGDANVKVFAQCVQFHG